MIDWGVFQIHEGDCLASMRQMAPGSARCCVTSPPYFGLRDYGHDGQIGLEETPDEYVAKLVEVFREVRRVLADDGTLWLNLGDSYANDGKWGGSSGGKHAKALHGNTSIGRTKVTTGLKPKDLIGIPWRVAFALQADGWYLRQDIVWHKPNPMPESVRDRCTKAHEYLFLLSKSERYYFDAEAMKEPAATAPGRKPRRANSFARKVANGQPEWQAAQHREGREDIAYEGVRNRRSVWTVATQPYKGAHFATYPPALIEPCVLAGSAPGDAVLDPFGGSGTTGVVAAKHGRLPVLC
jgi:DNA modification methylase